MTAAGLALMFVVLVVIVDPRGEFPLNDDWSFALSTWKSADAGHFVMARFSAMALKTQILWGALWSELFGRSFFVLRCSTLFLAWVALPIFYRFTARFMENDRAAAFVTLALLFHPIFFWSSFTYMTHVPFFFCALGAIALLDRYLRGSSAIVLVLSCLAIAAAYFLRQTGVGISAGALGAVVVLGWLRQTDRWRAAAVALLLTFTAFVVIFTTTDLLMGNKEQMRVHTEAYSGGVLRSISTYAELLFMTSARLAMNFVLFTLPLTLPFTLTMWRKERAVKLAFLGILPFVLAPAAFLVGTANAIPRFARGDILENIGLGPRTLRDTYTFRYDGPFAVSSEARTVITYSLAVFTAAFFAVFAVVLVRRWREASPPQRATGVILVFSAAAVCGAIAVGGAYFDRHALDGTWFLLPLLGLVFPWEHVRARRTALALLIALGFFVSGATADYLEWNRARWRAYEYLRSRGVTLKQMDGGFEINQYLIGGVSGPENLQKAGMSVIDDEYIISFNRVKGYDVMATFPYDGYFGLYRGQLYAMHRRVPFLVK